MFYRKIMRSITVKQKSVLGLGAIMKSQRILEQYERFRSAALISTSRNVLTSPNESELLDSLPRNEADVIDSKLRSSTDTLCREY